MLEKVKSILDCLEMTFGICLISKLTKLERKQRFSICINCLFFQDFEKKKKISLISELENDVC